MDLISEPVDQRSSLEAKIALFRSLFRGREDVYPRRFESRKTGRSGYAPACANEWVRGVCEKPRIKCAECPNRRFLPVTDDVIRWHLSGADAEGQPHDSDRASSPRLWNGVRTLVSIRRPTVSESRHNAARRVWKPHCSASPEGLSQAGQHGLPGQRLCSVDRPVGLPRERSQDRQIAGRTDSRGR